LNSRPRLAAVLGSKDRYSQVGKEGRKKRRGGKEGRKDGGMEGRREGGKEGTVYFVIPCCFFLISLSLFLFIF
jgi:hypothetical protein